jgi:hypothetical protein
MTTLTTSTQQTLSSLLLEITSKQKWYSKVFDDNITTKWKNEFLQKSPNSSHLFDLILSFAQATAQGSIHKSTCPWNEYEPLCKDCQKDMKRKVQRDPHKYNVRRRDLDDLFENDNWFEDMDFTCDCSKCSCTAPDCDLYDYVKYHPEGLISVDLHDRLKLQVQLMMQNEPIDWHPDSKEQVRDVIHPSMYCYVKGTSKLGDGSVESAGEEETRYQWLP